MEANSTETVKGNKTIKVTGGLSVTTGSSSSKMNFTETTGAFECDVFTVLAKSIVLEAPLVTVAGNLDVTGIIKAGGVLSNSGIVAPNLGRKDRSGTKGTAGVLSGAKAIRS
jgi:phage baseplate assembly protein gpV